MTTMTRILLRPEASLEALNERAAALGWKLVGDDAPGHSRPARRFWRPTPESEVGWYEDHGLGVTFVWVTNAPDLEAQLTEMLPRLKRTELLAAARSSDLRTALGALRALGVAEMGALSPELRPLLVRFMSHPVRIARRAALHLCWVGSWKELLPEIEKRSEADADLGAAWGRLADVLRKDA